MGILTHTHSGVCVSINVAENLGQKEKVLLVKALGTTLPSLSAKYLAHNSSQKNKI